MLSRIVCGFIIIRWLPYFVGYFVTGEPRIQMFNELQSFFRLSMQRFPKPRNQISTKMQVILNPRKLIPKKINDFTLVVCYNVCWRVFCCTSVFLSILCFPLINDMFLRFWFVSQNCFLPVYDLKEWKF